MADGTVRYIQNDVKYVSLEELGLADKGLKKGDRVVIGFDYHNDEIEIAYTNEEMKAASKKTRNYFIVSLGGSLLVAIVTTIIGRKTFGQPFYKYLKQLEYMESLEKKQTGGRWWRSNHMI